MREDLQNDAAPVPADEGLSHQATTDGTSTSSQKDHGSIIARCDERTKDAIDFLRWIRPDGPWVITAIIPDKKATASTFRPGKEDLMVSWLEPRLGYENLYFEVNSTGDKTITKKTSKDDIVAAEFLHVDIDGPPDQHDAIHDRLQAFKPAPSAIVFSGGGYQAFWRLAAAVDNLEAVENANRWIAEKLGGDNCHDICRIMRLPGTINVPNKKKREAGRDPTPAKLVSKNGSSHDLQDFGSITTVQSSKQAIVAVERAADYQFESLPEKVRAAAIDGTMPDGRQETDRSDAIYFIVAECVRENVPDAVIKSLLLDPDLEFIQGHMEKYRQNMEGYADRQIARGHGAVDQDASSAKQDFKRSGKKPDSPIIPCYKNARIAIQKLGVTTEFDSLANQAILGGHAVQDFAGPFTDRGMSMLRQLIIDQFDFDPKKEPTREAAENLCFGQPFNPLVRHLNGLEWDGRPRVDSWAVRVLGAPDDDLSRWTGRLLLAAMVRRARDPGCKYDIMIVLEGRQGTGKSTVPLILAGEEKWFSDATLFGPTVDDKKRGELLAGKWVNEVAELAGMNKTTSAELKGFITKQSDEFRPAYGRNVVVQPRHGILIGTTNESNYLRDRSGNRRYVPMQTDHIDLEGLRAERDQLLAEADATLGEMPLYPTEEGVISLLEEARGDRMHRSELFDLLGGIELPLTKRGGHAIVQGSLLLAMVMEMRIPNHLKTAAAVKAAMEDLGWEHVKSLKVDGRVFAGYRRPLSEPDQKDLEIPF